MNLPTIEVRFEDMNVTAETYRGSKVVPTVMNSYVSAVKVISRSLLGFLYYKNSICETIFITSS